jgi:hypothetical protein
MTADRRLWGFLARRAGELAPGHNGACEVDCAAVRPPVRPDQAGSLGTAGAGPTGLR